MRLTVNQLKKLIKEVVEEAMHGSSVDYDSIAKELASDKRTLTYYGLRTAKDAANWAAEGNMGEDETVDGVPYDEYVSNLTAALKKNGMR